MAPVARPCALMVVLVLVASRPVPAADAAKDPVEELREALQSLNDVQAKSVAPMPVRKKEWEAEAKAWEKKITAAEKAIVRLDDLCRSVLLDEWPMKLDQRDEADELGKRALFDPAIKEKEDPFDEPIKAVPALAESLKHKQLRVRLAALYALETLTADAAPAAGAVAAALKDDNRYIRWGAARALRNMAPAGAETEVRALAAVLGDDSPDVRHAAAMALAKCGPAAKDALTELTQAVRNGDEKMRLLALRALAAAGKEATPAEPELVKALADEKPAIRAAAAQALGRLGALKRESRESLTRALDDKDDKVRLAAAAALLGD